MNKETTEHQARLESLTQQLKEQEIQTQLDLHKFSQQFLGFDEKLHYALLEHFKTVSGFVKTNQAAYLGNSSTQDIVEAMKAANASGIAGGDIRGGDWIDDLGRIISALTKVAADEKTFFLKIIMKLLGCPCP